MRAPGRTCALGPSRHGSSGVTLVELMVSLVLGLIVAGAAIAVFISNRQTYIATESLDRLQEGGRIAFELMSRDLRAAATIPCSSETTFSNIAGGGSWWSDWTDADGGLRGYASDNPAFASSGGVGGRVADGDDDLFGSGWTDAVQALYASPPSAAPIVITAIASATTVPLTIPVNTVDGVANGDLLLACDYGFNDDATGTRRGPAAVVFQVASASGTTVKATNAAAFIIPEQSALQPNGLVSVLHANRWYIGHNAVGGTSLYRSSLATSAGAPGAIDEEIVRGADGLALGYLTEGASSYVDAGVVDAAGAWNDVVAVRMRLHLSGADKVDGAPIERTIEHVITIRNRAQ